MFSYYLDLGQGKRHVWFCECLDHGLLGREPGRESVRAIVALAVVDFGRRINLAQVVEGLVKSAA